MAIVWRAEHEPYSNVYLMRKGSRTDQPLRFPGQEAAMTWEGTEENYNVFRWYRGGWGRYTQGDPIGLRGGINPFAYALDNAVAAVDPFGLFCTKDFVLHYFFGKGKPIDLGQVGLLSAFKNAKAVKGSMESERNAAGATAEKRAKAACSTCGDGMKNLSFTLDETSYYVNNQDEPCLFSLGSSILVASSKCALTVNCKTKQYAYSCTSTWKLRDKFTDPLSTKESWNQQFEPGVPYAINADGSDYYNGWGGW